MMIARQTTQGILIISTHLSTTSTHNLLKRLNIKMLLIMQLTHLLLNSLNLISPFKIFMSAEKFCLGLFIRQRVKMLHLVKV